MPWIARSRLLLCPSEDMVPLGGATGNHFGNTGDRANFQAKDRA